MGSTDSKEAAGDWGILRGLLPAGWQAMAWYTGAVRRCRGLCDPERLLRVLLAHVTEDCSLVETAVRVRQAGWGKISAVALLRRLRASEQWLRWIAQCLFQRHRILEAGAGRRVLAVDATTVQETGPTGSVWRMHWMTNLEDLQCEYYELTDIHTGETFRRFPLACGDVVLGDRVYGNPPGIAWVVQHQADVVVRVNPHLLPLFCRPKRPFPLLQRLRRLKRGQVGQWQAWVHGPHGRWLEGRLIALHRSKAAVRRAQRHLRRHAQKQQRRPSRRSLELARYLLIWTSLPESEYPARRVLRLYRLRWQIELVFKRMKSIAGLGQLPKHADASAKAWLHGKLLVALLLERVWEAAEVSVSAPDIAYHRRRSRWREVRFLLKEVAVILVPRLGLARTLHHWNKIRQSLADSPRRRKRASLS